MGLALGQDREAGAFSHTAFQSIEEAVALDPSTLVVRWKQPYIDADQMFTIAYAYVPASAATGTAVEVEIFGTWVPGRISDEPLFDPKGERVRG